MALFAAIEALLQSASNMALPTRKREPRQAREGATVARKGVAGPFPLRVAFEDVLRYQGRRCSRSFAASPQGFAPVGAHVLAHLGVGGGPER